MDEMLATVVRELVKIGPAAIPWVVLLVITSLFVAVLRSLLSQLFAAQAVVMSLLREGAEADKQMAVEYRRLVDVVQSRPRR